MGALITYIIIGLIAGWIAGLIMKGRGLGIAGDIVVGIIGALIGGYIFRLLGVPTGGGFWGPLLTSIVGAVILLAIIGFVRRETT